MHYTKNGGKIRSDTRSTLFAFRLPKAKYYGVKIRSPRTQNIGFPIYFYKYTERRMPTAKAYGGETVR